MFKNLRAWFERLLRIPGDPESPPGDEAHPERFRAAPNYYWYLIAVWGLKTAAFLVVLLTMEIGPRMAVFGTRLHEKHLPAALLLGLPQLVLLFFLVGRLFSGLLVRPDFEKRWYLVTDRSLRLRTAFFRGVDNAITTRELIQARLRALKDSGLGDDDATVPAAPRWPVAVPVSEDFLRALREVAAEATALRSAS